MIRRACVLIACGLLAGVPAVRAQVQPEDTQEASYAPATLAKILGGSPRSQNDEAELAPAGAWFTTTATFTGALRKPSGRFRPLISSWVSSRGEAPEVTDLYFGGDLAELQFEQGGKKYWVLAGLPGGVGFEAYPPGQKLTLFLQRVGFASGTPVAVLRMARVPGGAPGAVLSASRGPATRVGEGERRQEAMFRSGSARFQYAGREYQLALDPAGRHSIAPGLYRYANGVRTALLEYGGSDTEYLLLRVTVPEAGEAASVVPYLVLRGRIVPPINLQGCAVEVPQVGRDGARGHVDCAALERAVLGTLSFQAE